MPRAREAAGEPDHESGQGQGCSVPEPGEPAAAVSEPGRSAADLPA